MALLAAIVLLALSAALVVGTVSLARAMRRAASTTRALARVETGASRAFGEVLQHWNEQLDSLPAGSGVTVSLDPEAHESEPPLERHAWVAHIANGLYAVTVELCAFDCSHPVARRRVRLWLQQTPGRPSPPPLVTPWAFSDLY